MPNPNRYPRTGLRTPPSESAQEPAASTICPPDENMLRPLRISSSNAASDDDAETAPAQQPTPPADAETHQSRARRRREARLKRMHSAENDLGGDSPTSSSGADEHADWPLNSRSSSLQQSSVAESFAPMNSLLYGRRVSAVQTYALYMAADKYD